MSNSLWSHTVGGQGLGPSLSFPRVMSLFFNIPGSILLVGGAVVSIWRFARKKEYAYRDKGRKAIRERVAADKAARKT